MEPIKTLLIFIFISQFALAQTKTDCNTVFICIDSISYEHIFLNTYVRDTLFFCRENTTKTSEDQYTGKYAIGRGANVEFFKPILKDKIGNHLHDFGIEFKTRSFGSLHKLNTTANRKKLAIDTSTTHLEEENLKIAWYKTIAIASPKANYELSILEYQKEYLQFLGFEGEELTQEMSFVAFNEKLSNGRKYPRQFNKIKSISLVVEKSKLPQFKAYCELNGLHQANKNSFANEEISLFFETTEKPNHTKIKAISLELLEPQKDRHIIVSDHLKIKVSGQICEILF